MNYACLQEIGPNASANQLDIVIGKNPKMIKLMSILNRIKDLDTTVLITGETGTGKSLLAKYLHNSGQNRNHPFVHINCAGIPATLMESELFGYEKGAFTGAQVAKPGKFEIAGCGTVFLDEICALPFELQAKLLTVLEERKTERLGSTGCYEVKSKIIAAANGDLENMVKQKTFREDLFYRLNVIQIAVPPLRSHKEDIEVLVNHFLNKYEKKFAKSMHTISPEVWIALKTYDWPGNIRELENVIERMVALTTDSMITLDDVNEKITHIDSSDASFQDVPQEKLQERAFILEMLRDNLGNRTKTAESLGISRRTLQYKLKQLKIT